MADLLSQDDLNALWGLSSGEGDASSPAGAKAEDPGSAGGISQADLDALWGDLTPNKEPAQATIAKEEPTSSIGDNLSQDDIDRLLADLGR